MKRVSHLYIYPVKSLGGIELMHAEVTSRGLAHDRRWMLVDEEHRFLTQRKVPELALFRTGFAGSDLVIHALGTSDDSIEVPLRPGSGEAVKVTVWDDHCDALRVSERADQWFSGKLKKSVRLVYMPDESLRPVDPDYARNQDITSFSDGYPVLMIGQESLDDLNSRLATPVPMQRFRPNIVFSGGVPYEEDEMKKFSVNGITFYGVKPCARCVVTTVDQNTAVTGKEPLRTLAQYRAVGHKVLFGQNILIGGTGTIHTGAAIEDLK